MIIRLPKEWIEASERAEKEGFELCVIGNPKSFRKNPPVPPVAPPTDASVGIAGTPSQEGPAKPTVA